jgi:hypothetical protein
VAARGGRKKFRFKNKLVSLDGSVKAFRLGTTPGEAAPPPPSEAAVLTVPSAKMQYPLYTRLYQTLNSSCLNGPVSRLLHVLRRATRSRAPPTHVRGHAVI